MAKKKSAPNQSEFIRRLPASMPAARVVARAKAAGMRIAPGLVYKVRSTAKSKARGKRKGSAKARIASGQPSASGFIRAMPGEMKATAVVEQGWSEGYIFKKGLVYKVRRVARLKSGSKVPVRIGRPPKENGGTAAEHKAAFRKLMILIGLDQAEVLYASVRRELQRI